MVKILHTGDLHLGSPFSGLPYRESERCRERQAEAFSKMIEYARREGISLFLIAGDLFDSDTVSASALDETFDALASLPCPVVIAPGNHDPYRSGSPYASRALPENLFVFDTEALSRFSFPEIGSGVDVFGYAFTGASLAASPLAILPDNSCLGEGLSILLCHGDLDTPLSRYAPIRSQDLARCGADYVALGHVHNTEDEILTVGSTAYAYCGFPEGRSFDECGFGSFRVITLSENADTPVAHAERIRCALHRYEILSCDVTGSASDEETAARVRTALSEKGFGRETSLRLYLCGEISPRYTPSGDRILALLEGGEIPAPLYFFDRTLPVFDSDYLESDLSLRGELYRILKPQILSGSERERADAALALRLGLAALDERPIL